MDRIIQAATSRDSLDAVAEDFVITVEDGSTHSKTGYISHSAEPSVHVDVASHSSDSTTQYIPVG